MAAKGLKVWRSMPKARRQNLNQKGVDTRKEKAQFGKQLARSRRQGTKGPTAKNATGAARQRARAGTTGPEEESATGGVAPRGVRVERTRKTTTAGGKVGVTRTGVTSGGPGPEAYRQFTTGPTGGGGKKGKKALGKKALGRKSKGRAVGGIRKPGKGGPGKRLIAKGGGGRAALQTWRALPGPQRQRMLKNAPNAKRLVQQVRQSVAAAPPKPPAQKRKKK